MTPRAYAAIGIAILIFLLGLWSGCAIATPEISSSSDTTREIIHVQTDTVRIPMPVVSFVEVPGETQVITRYYDRLLRDTVQAQPFKMAATRYSLDTTIGADSFSLAHTVLTSRDDYWDFRWQPAPRLELRDTTIITERTVQREVVDNRGDFAVGIGPYIGLSPAVGEAGKIGVVQSYGVSLNLSYKLFEF